PVAAGKRWRWTCRPCTPTGSGPLSARKGIPECGRSAVAADTTWPNWKATTPPSRPVSWPLPPCCWGSGWTPGPRPTPVRTRVPTRAPTRRAPTRRAPTGRAPTRTGTWRRPVLPRPARTRTRAPNPAHPRTPCRRCLGPPKASAPPPTALARLLPDASEDDDELNAEFRRLTESDLRRTKVARLRTVWETLRRGEGQLRIPVQDGMDWAAALNDVRLVISERLEITTEAEAEAIQQRAAGAVAGSEDEVRQALGMVYSALSWLQESLLQVMLPTLED